MLHGGPGLSDYTEGLAAELGSMFDTIRYQQRGLAPTTLRGPYTVESHVADAIDLLNALQIDRAWMIGSSWGGHLAMHIAVAHPDRLLGLIALDPLGAVGDGGMQEMGKRVTERISAADLQRAEELDRRVLGGELSDEAALESFRLIWPSYFASPRSVVPMPPMRLSARCYSETFKSIAEHFQKGTLEHGLPRYRGTAIFVHGRESNLPVSASQVSAALIPGSSVTILDDCGHFAWMEKPGLIAQTLRQIRRF
jgi:pimeloyl-ACP methyl ester carboxylesterase